MTAERPPWTLGRVVRGIGRRVPLRPLRIVFPYRPWRQLFRLWLATIRAQPDRRKALTELFLASDDVGAALDRGALDYGGGVHPKHHLTGYHDFFVDRIGAGERVLDVGCGIGSVAHDIAARSGAEVIGIDTSPWSLDVARRRFAHPRVTDLQANALGADLRAAAVVQLLHQHRTVDARGTCAAAECLDVCQRVSFVKDIIDHQHGAAGK